MDLVLFTLAPDDHISGGFSPSEKGVNDVIFLFRETSQDIPRPKIVKPPLCCECETSRKSLVASKELASNPTSKRSFDTPTVNSLTMSRQAAHIRIQKKHETKNKRKCIIVYPN